MIGHLSIFKNTLEFSSLLLIVFGENGGEQRKFKKVQDLILEKKTCKSHAQKSFQPALCRSGEYCVPTNPMLVRSAVADSVTIAVYSPSKHAYEQHSISDVIYLDLILALDNNICAFKDIASRQQHLQVTKN
jgi:hypothetical protein